MRLHRAAARAAPRRRHLVSLRAGGWPFYRNTYTPTGGAAHRRQLRSVAPYCRDQLRDAGRDWWPFKTYQQGMAPLSRRRAFASAVCLTRCYGRLTAASSLPTAHTAHTPHTATPHHTSLHTATFFPFTTFASTLPPHLHCLPPPLHACTAFPTFPPACTFHMVHPYISSPHHTTPPSSSSAPSPYHLPLTCWRWHIPCRTPLPSTFLRLPIPPFPAHARTTTSTRSPAFRRWAARRSAALPRLPTRHSRAAALPPPAHWLPDLKPPVPYHCCLFGTTWTDRTGGRTHSFASTTCLCSRIAHLPATFPHSSPFCHCVPTNGTRCPRPHKGFYPALPWHTTPYTPTCHPACDTFPWFKCCSELSSLGLH